MSRVTSIAAAICLSMIFGLTVTAGQAQDSSSAMSVAETEEVFIGNTSIGVYNAMGAKFAQYLAPDGSSVMKVKHTQLGVRQFKGKHYFNDQGKLCINYPSLPGPKLICARITALGDGRYKLSGNVGSIGEVVEGKQLNRLR